MSSMPPSVNRVFILSKDYGELGILLSLLKLDEGMGHLVFFPEGCFTEEARHNSSHWIRYREASSILNEISLRKPNEVILCSGLLLATNRLFSVRQVKQLTDLCDEVGAQIHSTDPFLGLGRNLRAQQLRLEKLMGATVAGWKSRLINILGAYKIRASAKTLKHAIYIYPVPIGSEERHALGVEARSFREPPMLSAHTTSPDKPKTWMAVLSHLDAKLLCSKATQGDATLPLKPLIGTLHHLVYMAPSLSCAFPLNIKSKLPADLQANIDWIPPCDHHTFMTHLLYAEKAFYWNLFSHSILTRIHAEAETYFFAKGHLCEFCPDLYQRGIQFYYSGREPEILDEDFTEAELTEQGETWVDFCRHFVKQEAKHSLTSPFQIADDYKTEN